METLQDLYIYIYIYVYGNIIYIYLFTIYMYKIHELILKNYCSHYVYYLINTIRKLVHRHNIKNTLFMKFTLVKFKYVYLST